MQKCFIGTLKHLINIIALSIEGIWVLLDILLRPKIITTQILILNWIFKLKKKTDGVRSL